MKITIDSGATFLAVCACGWRGLPTSTRATALRQAVHHEQRAHPADRNAWRALYEHRNRHAGGSSDT